MGNLESSHTAHMVWLGYLCDMKPGLRKQGRKPQSEHTQQFWSLVPLQSVAWDVCVCAIDVHQNYATVAQDCEPAPKDFDFSV